MKYMQILFLFINGKMRTYISSNGVTEVYAFTYVHVMIKANSKH
jgi:hypothetical protein